MKQAVIDASVAAKWVVEEDHSDHAVRLLSLEARHAPSHWRAEAVNVLWAKVFHGDLTAADAEERMGVLLRAPIIDTPIEILMPRAFAISVARMVTIYDGLSIALAEKLTIPLVTADQRLIRKMSDDATLSKLMIWIGDY